MKIKTYKVEFYQDENNNLHCERENDGLTKIFNKMAKTIELLPNKIRIKYLVKEKKYYLFYGSQQCMIDSEYQNGFNSFEDAKQKGLNLEVNGYYTKTIK